MLIKTKKYGAALFNYVKNNLNKTFLAIVFIVAVHPLYIYFLPAGDLREALTNKEINRQVFEELVQQRRYHASLAIGGVAAVVGVYFAFRRTVANEEQVKVDKKRLTAERYTKAVELLAHESLAVRQGGIYALERVMKDSTEEYHNTIIEVLCSFIRARKPEEGYGKETGSAFPDVTCAATVLSRRNILENEIEIDLHKANIPSVDLSRICLRSCKLYRANLESADLSKANLEGANLEWVNLERANLQEAKLQGASFRQANLHEARLQWAELQGANIQSANIHDAELNGTSLQGANLQAAILQGARLQFANLHEANLERANLQEAKLQGANLQEAKLQGTVLNDANLHVANLVNTDLKEANLHRAILIGTSLKRADLERSCFNGADLQEADFLEANLYETYFLGANLLQAKNLTAEQLSNTKSLYVAQIDEDLDNQLKELLSSEEYQRLRLEPPEDLEENPSK